MAAPIPWSCFLLLCLYIADLSNGLLVKQAIYSTKTPYFWLKDADESTTDDSETWAEYEDKTCQILHLNAVLRHGARFPTSKWIKRMNELHVKLVQNGDVDKYQFLKTWRNPFTDDTERLLTELGEQEQFELGKRFGRRFRLLFEDDIDNMKMFVSSKQRTQASADAFYEGLSESLQADPEVEVEHVVDDISLRFHDNCNEYTNSVEKNDSVLIEYKKFKNGPEITNVGNSLKQLLGLDALSADEINTIYQLCALELAHADKSDWCQFLNEENVGVIEYLNDLKQYWKKAYGSAISKSMTCPLLGGIFKEIDNAIEQNEHGNDFTVGVFYFGHVETLAPLYAAFGLFKDELELKADNFKEHANRKFRSSTVFPFSANIAVAVYECDVEEDLETDDDTDTHVYTVKMYVNEKSVIIPACGKIMCPYNLVREFYKQYVDKCDFNRLCKNPEREKHDEL